MPTSQPFRRARRAFVAAILLATLAFRMTEASAETLADVRDTVSTVPLVEDALSEPETTAPPSSSSVLWSSDFERADWKTPWRLSMDSHSGNRTVVSGLGGNAGRALKITASSDNNGFTGMGVLMRSLFENIGVGAKDEVRLRYRFYLPSNWNPYAGGKLPGLAGITGGLTVGQTPGGGNYDERGWSGRLMWKKAVDGDADRTPLVSYLYVRHAAGKSIYDNRNVNNNRIYGIQVPFRDNPDHRKPGSTTQPLLHPKRGQWNTVELRYRMNTPGQSDGIFQAWLNGTLGVDVRDVQYRTANHPGLAVNELMFDSFYGGPTSNSTTQTWAFDDVVLLRP